MNFFVSVSLWFDVFDCMFGCMYLYHMLHFTKNMHEFFIIGITSIVEWCDIEDKPVGRIHREDTPVWDDGRYDSGST